MKDVRADNNRTDMKNESTYDINSYRSYLPEKSVHQSDERIFHRGGYTYDEVKTVDSVTVKGRAAAVKVRLDSGAAATLTLHLWSEDVLRLNFTLDGVSSPIEETSDMLVSKAGGEVLPTLEKRGGTPAIRFGSRTVVFGQERFGFQVLDANEHAVFETETYRLAGGPLAGALGFRIPTVGNGKPEPYLSWSIRNNERFFGLGEKWNKVEKSSTRATVWASDTCGSNSNDLSYKSIPYLLSSRGWGMFLHTSFRSLWEIGTFSYISGSCLTEDDKLDAFLFFGDGFKKLIEHYTGLTGRPQPVPDWALGVWMSRCQYMNAGEAEEAMDGLRGRDIPADVIHLDPLWMKTHYYFKIRVDACDFVRNDAAFPDLPRLMKKWRGNGFRTCLWINPYLPEGSEIYEYAQSRDFLLKSLRGGLARLSHGEPVGMVDFSNPAARAWWKGKLKELLADGAAVLKPDYGDRVPEDALFHNGKTGRELHNMFLFWFTETCYQACQEVHGYGMVWRRSGYIGSQRYPGTWAGDTRSTWREMLACLRGGLSAGFNGDAFWGSDIGGFCGPVPTPELYIRWAQWGLLSPLSRFHGTSCPREPWHFGETAVEVVRHYAKLRYRLIPYLKACAEEAYATGVPILRHLHLEYPNEPGTEWIDDQYLLGPDLLVAPVFAAGATQRAVYFPSGEWIDFDDASKVYDGPRWHTVPAPLERIPLFRRAGATLPAGPATP